MKIKNNDIITFYGISWNDGWEFGNPNLILSPIVEFTYDAGSIEAAIDELCLELSINEVESEVTDTENWRGWEIKEFTDFVVNYFENKPYKIPQYFIDYYNNWIEDKEDYGIDSDEECWNIIGLHISKFVIKFTLNNPEEENEDFFEYNYEIIDSKIEYIENEI